MKNIKVEDAKDLENSFKATTILFEKEFGESEAVFKDKSSLCGGSGCDPSCDHDLVIQEVEIEADRL